MMQKVYEVYDKVSLAIRGHLSSNGFLEYKANVLGPVPDPGIRGSKQVTVDYYGWVILVVKKA